MDLQLSQDSLDSFIVADIPVTPDPPHATIPESTTAAVSRIQANRIDNATSHMTPPPSTQVPSSHRAKTRTPTPTISHISTPPPTIELPTQSQASRVLGGFAGNLSAEQIAIAPIEELRTKVTELQAALQEAKMSAAHHKLQYQMLSQESAAAIERMAVEARMAQYENEVIHTAEQAKAAATPAQPSPFMEGMIPVQKDLYQRLLQEIRHLTDDRNYLAEESAHKEKILTRQDVEIASLSDKVMMMRERIRENREHVNRYRRGHASSHLDSTPRSRYGDPLRHGLSSQKQPQPFAALLQASEMASQEAHRPMGAKKGHVRNTHSTGSLPVTPHRSQPLQGVYQTPQGRQPLMQVPSTAPLPRTSALRSPDVYSQQSLPVPKTQGPPSEGTVSASDHDDEDSEAETDIIGEGDLPASQAARAAAQMLRSSREQRDAKRDSFSGPGMLQQSGGGRMKQTRLFGEIRKSGVERGEGPPAKRARIAETVGLGIAGVRD